MCLLEKDLKLEKYWNVEMANLRIFWIFYDFSDDILIHLENRILQKRKKNGKYGYMNGTLKHKTWHNAPEEGQTDEFPFRMNSRFI